MSIPENDPSMDPVKPGDIIEPSPSLDQPNPPEPPVDAPQTFKCNKCGATFTDEGSAAAHMQTCKGISDEEPEEQGVENPQATGTPAAM